MNQNNIDILLSVYNGEKYLKGQIDSILNQTNKSWGLIIRDDGSTDSSFDTIKNYSENDYRITLIQDTFGNLGPCQSFAELLEHSSAEYIMFCDQDDIWLPEKIDTLLKEIKSIEKIYPDEPILVASDLSLINMENQTIASSFWKYQKLNPDKGINFSLLVQNKFPGCSMIFNNKLKELATPIPEKAMMHDWWVCLIGFAFGKIAKIDTPLVLYRQHESNTIGISKSSIIGSLLRVIRKKPSTMRNISDPERTLGIEQAKAFLEKFRNRLSSEQLNILEYITKPSISGCIKNGIHREPLSSDLIFYLGLILIKFKKLFNLRNNVKR
jgi:glycosyltransferase involved in cell wall biosynthesis